MKTRNQAEGSLLIVCDFCLCSICWQNSLHQNENPCEPVSCKTCINRLYWCNKFLWACDTISLKQNSSLVSSLETDDALQPSDSRPHVWINNLSAFRILPVNLLLYCLWTIENVTIQQKSTKPSTTTESVLWGCSSVSFWSLWICGKCFSDQFLVPK